MPRRKGAGLLSAREPRCLAARVPDCSQPGSLDVSSQGCLTASQPGSLDASPQGCLTALSPGASMSRRKGA
jgi:hypothetical protein